MLAVLLVVGCRCELVVIELVELVVGCRCE